MNLLLDLCCLYNNEENCFRQSNLLCVNGLWEFAVSTGHSIRVTDVFTQLDVHSLYEKNRNIVTAALIAFTAYNKTIFISYCGVVRAS
jgi:hypothetical protein